MPDTTTSHNLSLFRHEAMLYSGRDGFLEGVLPFLRGGLAAGEPMLVVVDAEKIRALQAELGDDAARVQFTDMAALGENPARIIPAWQSFLDAHHTAQQPARGVGEPIWASRRPAELVECQRHEALLNLAFAEVASWTLLCPYDVGALAPEVIAEAHRSHPWISEQGVTTPSQVWAGVEAMAAPPGDPLGPPPVPAGVVEFNAPSELAAIRAVVRAMALAAGLDPVRTFDFTLAVDEIASNCLRHGGGSGTLVAWTEPDAVVCEVRDRGGTGSPHEQPLAGRIHPGVHQVDGRGLWLANQVCSLVQIRTDGGGTSVRLRLNLGRQST
jgi:anti-sigma regulatory factor (Ser/Thr protein kinase)